MSASWSPWRRDFDGEAREAFLFMLPLLAFIAALVLIPVLGTLLDSLFRDVTFLPRRFIGWANYLALVKDPAFRKSLRFTLFFVGVSVPLEVTLGLLIALVLNEPFRLRGVVRAALLIPWAIPMAALSCGMTRAVGSGMPLASASAIPSMIGGKSVPELAKI